MRKTVPPPDGRIHYPTEDGQPLAETELHAHWMFDVWHRLKRRYAARPDVHVGGNLLLYYVEGDPRQCISPDAYVTFGMDKAPRDTYLLWLEGRPPDVVFEMTSRSTQKRDLGIKKLVYQQMGVREYFLYDPYGEYIAPRLMGFRLLGEDSPEYVRIAGPPLPSEVLDVLVALDERGGLLLIDRQTGEPLPSGDELAEREAERAEQEVERAEREAERAAREAERAAREAERAQREAERAAREAERADREAERADREALRVRELEARLRELEQRPKGGD